MEESLIKTQFINKMCICCRTDHHIQLRRECLIGTDDMAVPLSGNMLLQPEQEGLPGSKALMQPLDHSLQGGDTSSGIRSRRTIESVSRSVEVRNNEDDFSHS